MELLLDIWREACRHTEIAEVIERIAPLLAQRLPADALVVRRLHAERLHLDTAAVGACGRTPLLLRARTELAPARLSALLSWCQAGRVARGRAGGRGDAVLEAVTPPDWVGDVIAGPLVEGERIHGVLVLLAAREAFGEDSEELAQQILEPIAVALSNDSRVQELVRLRSALEADKHALLTRLGREEITDAVVGVDGGLRPVLQRVEQVSATDVPVLLLGETGTGKEVVAREIHRHSARADGPVVRVNCGAIPAGLIDSELFGHERGSFTGAVTTREGWFERADGGTLFLDEIGELPLEAQVRLLRVLQDGTFERVGGRRAQRVDVRVVAATHRDLAAMVRAGTFREDLWYRISVFPIRLPPLRERIADIPALASHFAARAGRRLGGAPLVPTPEDVALLTSQPWPGNVRELGAVIERAAILGGGRTLELRLALGISTTTPGSAEEIPSVVPATPARPALPTLDAATAHHIEQALLATRGRIEGPFGAAALLGVNPHTLRAKMRKLGVEWSRFRGAAASFPAPAPAAP